MLITNELKRMFLAYLATLDVRAMLLMEDTSAATENAGITRVSHYSSLKEFDGSGYSRQALANKAVTANDTTGEAEFTADNLTFGNLSGGTADPAGVLLFRYVDGTAANDVPLAYLPFEEPLAVDGSAFVAQWGDDLTLICS